MDAEYSANDAHRDVQMLTAKGTVFDVAKSRLVFLVGQGKKVWIDGGRVSSPL